MVEGGPKTPEELEDMAYEYLMEGEPTKLSMPDYLEAERMSEEIENERQVSFNYPVPNTSKEAEISVTSNRRLFRDLLADAVINALSAALVYNFAKSREVKRTLERMISICLSKSGLMIIYPEDLKVGLDQFVRSYEMKREAGCTPEEAQQDSVSRFRGFLDEKS